MKTVSVAKIKRLKKKMYARRVQAKKLLINDPKILYSEEMVDFYNGAIFACKQLLEFGVDKKAKK